MVKIWLTEAFCLLNVFAEEELLHERSSVHIETNDYKMKEK